MSVFENTVSVSGDKRKHVFIIIIIVIIIIIIIIIIIKKIDNFIN